MPREAPARPPRFLIPVALVYLVFVVYGSLVPLIYVPMPMPEAWHKFQQIPYLHLGVQSRADWVANIILFVPLAFLGTAIIAAGGGTARKIAGTAFVLVACVGLSVAIEFTQIFFPQRTVSMNDLIAESLGTGIGITAWWFAGSACLRWLERWRRARGRASTATSLLWLYLATVFLYNIMPLDLILSPVEIYHKLTDGRVVLVPFSKVPSDFGSALYGLATDVLVWVAPAMLWMFSGRSRRSAWWRTTLAAAAIEGFQLFVYTRVSDVTDVVTASMGAGLGVWIGGRLVRRGTDAPSADVGSPARTGREPRWALWGALAFAAWAIGVCVAFWYPFDFVLERRFIFERLHRLATVPFADYYFQSEYTALSTAMRKFFFFLPGGVTLAVMLRRFRAPRARWLAAIGAILAILLAAAAVELVQVLLPAKYPDPTDPLIETLGGAAGYGLAVMIWNRLGSSPAGR